MYTRDPIYIIGVHIHIIDLHRLHHTFVVALWVCQCNNIDVKKLSQQLWKIRQSSSRDVSVTEASSLWQHNRLYTSGR